MRAIAVTKLSERRTKVVCGNTTYYVNQTEAPDPGMTPGSFIVDDGEDRKTVSAMSAEDAVERHLDPPPTYRPFGSPPPPHYQYTLHMRGSRTFVTAPSPLSGAFDVAEQHVGLPLSYTPIPAATAGDAVDEYVRRNP